MNECCVYTVCQDELIYEIKRGATSLDTLFLKVISRYSKLLLTDANNALIRRIALEIDVAKDIEEQIRTKFKAHLKQLFDCNCA